MWKISKDTFLFHKNSKNKVESAFCFGSFVFNNQILRRLMKILRGHVSLRPPQKLWLADIQPDIS